MIETIEYKNPKADRENWIPGPWHDEPDKKQWSDPATGLPCLIVRNEHVDRCGYVGVLKSHALYGKPYDAAAVDVHGGLTFADRCAEHGRDEGSICHIAPEDEDDVWWFGFDCAHAYDASPSRHMSSLNNYRDVSYRDFQYVTDQVTALAAQLVAL